MICSIYLGQVDLLEALLSIVGNPYRLFFVACLKYWQDYEGCIRDFPFASAGLYEQIVKIKKKTAYDWIPVCTNQRPLLGSPL
jgi:hypothetical protein